MFTDEEILTQLDALGFREVTDEQLQALRTDLDLATRQQEWIANVVEAPFHGPASEQPRLPIGPVDSNVDQCNRDNVNLVFNQPRHVKIEKLKPNSLRHRGLSLDRQDNFDENNENYPSAGVSRASSSQSTFSGSIAIDVLSQRSDSSKNSLASWTSSDCSSNSHKRKVLRQRNGVPIVCDEKMAHSGASIISVEKNGRKLRELADQGDWSPVKKVDNVRDKTKSSARFRQVAKKWRSLGDLTSASGSSQALYKPKSVILPYSSQPQAHQFYKTDPVALYHYYRKEWSSHKAPGEKEHKQLRWNIRTRMARRDEPTTTSTTKRPQSRLSVFST